MDVDIEEKNRSVIPRWRDFKTTLALGELNPVGGREVRASTATGADIADLQRDWDINRTLAFASDLVAGAFVLGLTSDIEEAAALILSDGSGATPLQQRVAKQATDPEFAKNFIQLNEVHLDSRQVIEKSKENIRLRRQDLQRSLRNPITLVELAREFAILGATDKAVRTMIIAASLGPSNRFVIRSAARLFVHAGLHDRAHHILRRAPSLKYDPWLLAAEIAVATMRNLVSPNVKRGITLSASEDFGSLEVSELSSAVATVEMGHGSTKNARKLFRRSLRRPTDNSMAQAEWATRRSVAFDLELGQYSVERNFEALAWNYFATGKMQEALNLGKSWILDQPFAASPINFAGMVADLSEDYNMADQIYRFGLRANPENATLRNNYAFSLASSNNPKEAQKQLDKIDKHDPNLSSQLKIVMVATQGLIKFRSGLIEEGQTLYRRAIEMARDNNEPAYELRALVYLAREEIDAGTINSIDAFEKVMAESRNYTPSLEVSTLLRRMESSISEQPEKFDWVRLRKKELGP